MFWLLIKKALGTVSFFFGTYLALLALFSEDLRRDRPLALLGMVILSLVLLGSGVRLWNARYRVGNQKANQEDDSNRPTHS